MPHMVNSIERRILAAAASARGGNGGVTTAGHVFRAVVPREARPYLGDHLCWEIVGRLVRARMPLLALVPSSDADEAGVTIGARTPVRITPDGKRVLRGEADYVALNGVDRWIGGVHLAGDTARWRFDEGTKTIV